MARMNLIVGDDIPQLLTGLAEGERKRGEYLTQLVRTIEAGEDSTPKGIDIEGLRLQLLGLAGVVKQLQGRVVAIEAKASVTG
jgi:hypothetical protein